MSKKLILAGVFSVIACAAPSQGADGAKPKKAAGDAVSRKGDKGEVSSDAPAQGGKSAPVSGQESVAAAAPVIDGGGSAVAPISIPLVEGFPSFGLRLPDLDEQGKLRSFFVIGSVSRLNDREVQIKDSLVETYGADGSREMSIELPEAKLDRITRILVANVPVTIRRDEFEVTGATMEFNTVTREGGLGGPVRMLLYNLDGGKKSGEASPQPAGDK